MKKELQTVYIPIKEKEEYIFAITEEIRDYMLSTSHVMFYPDNKSIYIPAYITEAKVSENELYHIPTHRLDPQELIIFTQEEFNSLLKEFGEELLKVASENVKLSEFGCKDNRLIDDKIEGTYFCPSYFGEDKEIDVTKSSITEVLHQVLEQFKIK